MARKREWLTHLNDKQVLIKIDGLLDNSYTWDMISQSTRVEKIKMYRWYYRRKARYDLQKSLRDFDRRLRAMEESIAKGMTYRRNHTDKEKERECAENEFVMRQQDAAADLASEFKSMLKLKAVAEGSD